VWFYLPPIDTEATDATLVEVGDTDGDGEPNIICVRQALDQFKICIYTKNPTWSMTSSFTILDKEEVDDVEIVAWLDTTERQIAVVCKGDGLILYYLNGTSFFSASSNSLAIHRDSLARMPKYNSDKETCSGSRERVTGPLPTTTSS